MKVRNSALSRALTVAARRSISVNSIEESLRHQIAAKRQAQYLSDSEIIRRGLATSSGWTSTPHCTLSSSGRCIKMGAVRGLCSFSSEALPLKGEALHMSSTREKVEITPAEVVTLMEAVKDIDMEDPTTRPLLWQVRETLASCRQPFNSFMVSRAFSALKNLSSRHYIIRAIMKEYSRFFRHCSDGPFPNEVASAMLGLRGLCSSEDRIDASVLDLLSSLAQWVRRCKGEATASGCSIIIYSLANLKVKHKEAVDLIEALIPILDSDKAQIFTAKQAVRMFYGLRSCVAQSPAAYHGNETIQDLLRVVCRLLANTCTESFSARDCATMMSGLQNLRGDSEEAIHILHCALRYLRTCDEPISPQEAAMIVHGLKGLRFQHEVEMEVLFQAKRLLRNCVGSITVNGLAMMLLGLQGMSSKSPEVVELIGLINQLAEGAVGEVAAHDIAQMVFGLQGCSSKHVEVRQLLGMITSIAQRCEQEISGKSVSMLMLGMQGMSSKHNEVVALIGAINCLLIRSRGPLSEGYIFGHEVIAILDGLRGFSSRHAEVLTLLTELTGLINTCHDPLPAEEVIFGLGILKGLSRERMEVVEFESAVLRLIPRERLSTLYS